MLSFFKRIKDFFIQIFSFGRQILSDPFFDHIFAIAGLLYPPAAPVIQAVDRLFEEETREGFLTQLDQLLSHSGLDNRQAEIIKNLVAMLALIGQEEDTGQADCLKLQLAREVLKTAIAGNRGLFREYGVLKAVEENFDLRIKGTEDKDKVPDHVVNFAIEFSVVQKKFNRMLDQLIVYSRTAMQPLLDATPGEIDEVLEAGRQRGLWEFTSEDYEKPEVRKRVAALLTKEEAVEENFRLWGQMIDTIEAVPDSLANLAVEACYADYRALLPVEN